ncbi:MAG TPA: acetylxylan esterase, partial [Planctomycetaceae bacterium]|nr:acetylxylan esterase [Planctomycetaceae bacterium]
MRQGAFTVVLVSLSAGWLAAPAGAQQWEVNYDENKVPQYELPDPLVLADGQPVRDAQTWYTKRRPEILRLFEQYVYGKVPPRPEGMKFQLQLLARDALEGKAIRKQVRILLAGTAEGPHIDLLLYVPSDAPKPVPVFIGLNFYGNHTVHPDPGILLCESWVRNNSRYGIENHRATEASRGVARSRWAVEMILRRGYGLATAYYGDIDPDFDDGFQNGVHPLFYKPGQTKPASDEWGSIGA